VLAAQQIVAARDLPQLEQPLAQAGLRVLAGTSGHSMEATCSGLRAPVTGRQSPSKSIAGARRADGALVGHRHDTRAEVGFVQVGQH